MKKYIQADTETNYLNMTEEEWEAHNADVIADFARWLDKPGKSDFEADPYSIFEKMTFWAPKEFYHLRSKGEACL